ncbi:MAG TPA: hypothetical protein VMM78_18690 [Thermomicrobiales bacterium]|nr:hypothetical protein [Thermomicrobiales bacterium]
MTPDLQQLARSGPLIPPLGMLLIVLAFAIAAFLLHRFGPRERAPWLLPELGALAALSLAHLLFFWQPYRTGALVPRGGGDLASFFYPMHAFAAGELQTGRFPFWNPHLFSGAPHLANFQTGALYPPNLLAYLVARPFEYATLELLAIGHFLLASYGAYWLARALSISRAGAVLAGIVYAYSGFLVAHLGHYPMLVTASWAPFVFAAVIGTVRYSSWSIALLGAPALALAILGGHQPMLLLTLAAALAIGLFELWRATDYAYPASWTAAARAVDWQVERDRARPHVTRLAFMALIGAGLAAPALGPALAMTGHTVRAGLGYETAAEFSVQPTALLHLILPTIYGSNPTDYWGPFSNTEMWGYTGVLALALAAYGLVIRPGRTRLFWLLAALVSLLFLLGPYTPLHGWTYAFAPGFDRMRGAGRAFMFFDLAVALLAAWGLDGLLCRQRSGFARNQAALKWGALGLAGALLVVVGFVIPLFASNVIGIDAPSNRPVIALDNAVMLALWLALGLALALIAWRTTLRGGALAVLVVSAVVLSLFHATAPFNPTTQPILAGYGQLEVVTFLRERRALDGPFRIEAVSGPWQPNLPLLAGIDDIGGLYDPLAIKAYDDYRSHAVLDRGSDAYRALNVRYIVSAAGSQPPAPGVSEALRTESLTVWELADWQPRAWIAGSGAPVNVIEHGPDSLTLLVPTSPSPSLVVVSQTWHPGWTARADGQELGVGQYDGVLQVVYLPPNVSTVELSFRPESWALWLALGALAALVWLAALALTLRPHWRARRDGVSSDDGGERRAVA